MELIAYTDGSCNNRGTHRAGGFSAVLPSEELVLIGGEMPSTSARMELCAVSAVVQHCYKYKDVDLTIYSDAEYIVKSFNEGWVYDWIKIGFINTKNKDIWKQLLRGIQTNHISSFRIIHVRGHSGIELNELADRWAGEAAKRMKEINSKSKEGAFAQKHGWRDLRIH